MLPLPSLNLNSFLICTEFCIWNKVDLNMPCWNPLPWVFLVSSQSLQVSSFSQFLAYYEEHVSLRVCRYASTLRVLGTYKWNVVHVLINRHHMKLIWSVPQPEDCSRDSYRRRNHMSANGSFWFNMYLALRKAWLQRNRLYQEDSY